jgi:hypothetical protein
MELCGDGDSECCGFSSAQCGGEWQTVCNKYCMTPLDVHSTNTVGFVYGIGGSVVESTFIISLSFRMKTAEFAAACIYFVLRILDNWGLIFISLKYYILLQYLSD